jgi:hypothetical protein
VFDGGPYFKRAKVILQPNTFQVCEGSGDCLYVGLRSRILHVQRTKNLAGERCEKGTRFEVYYMRVYHFISLGGWSNDVPIY